ncbi:SubName: Full=Uncharacterized protein {ECO:0000313/EMBL:CCA67356.1} [Serendipita indica DSM 11827]|nr:SubName: Full=Uncharacterized protein {ECO:0000313/EMBL:CCA67356.1} [Serendipita indica DSM 11827]
MTKAAMLLPNYGFDPTEAAIPYKYLTEKGWVIDIVTESGKCQLPLSNLPTDWSLLYHIVLAPKADQMMLTGTLASLLGAKAAAKDAYTNSLSASTSFKEPKAWNDPEFSLTQYDVVIIPGGHERRGENKEDEPSKGVRQIIESRHLRSLLSEIWPYTRDKDGSSDKKMVVGAIWFVEILTTVYLFDFTKDETGNSILYDRKMTTLPEHLERLAHSLTGAFIGDYYRTYPGRYTAALVQECLATPEQYLPGLLNLTG